MKKIVFIILSLFPIFSIAQEKLPTLNYGFYVGKGYNAEVDIQLMPNGKMYLGSFNDYVGIGPIIDLPISKSLVEESATKGSWPGEWKVLEKGKYAGNILARVAYGKTKQSVCFYLIHPITAKSFSIPLDKGPGCEGLHGASWGYGVHSGNILQWVYPPEK